MELDRQHLPLPRRTWTLHRVVSHLSNLISDKIWRARSTTQVNACSDPWECPFARNLVSRARQATGMAQGKLVARPLATNSS